MADRKGRQLHLFQGIQALPALSCKRLQRRTRNALGQYARGVASPSFLLRTLAEEQARLELLRAAEHRMARRDAKSSRLRRVQFLVSAGGARLHRAVERSIRKIEQLEERLLCA